MRGDAKADTGGGTWKGTLSGMGLKMVPGGGHCVSGGAAAHG